MLSLFIVFGSKFLFDATRTHSRSSLRNLNFTFSAFFHDRSSKFKAFPQALPLSPRVFYGLILIPFYFVLPCWTYPSFSRVQGILWPRKDHRKENKDTLSQMRRYLLKPAQVLSLVCCILILPYYTIDFLVYKLYALNVMPLVFSTKKSRSSSRFFNK